MGMSAKNPDLPCNHIQLKIDLNATESVRDGQVIAVAKSLRQDWSHIPDESFKVQQLKGGITNKLFQCTTVRDNIKEVVLTRVYGANTEIFINRSQEVKNFIFLGQHKMAPPFYGTFGNGCAYGYFPGRSLIASDMQDAKLRMMIARELGKWHALAVDTTNVEPSMFQSLKKFLLQIPKELKNPAKNEVFQKNVDLEKLAAEVNMMEQLLTKLNSPITLVHGDLLLGNIIYNADAREVRFCDYEYASLSYRGFDLGNHFDEYAGIDNPDFGLYPNKDSQFAFFREYLAARGDAVTDDNIQQLYREANGFALAAHLYWGMWALIQESISDIDFGFLDYGLLRFSEYYKRKEEFVAIANGTATSASEH